VQERLAGLQPLLLRNKEIAIVKFINKYVL
jgi:hypothetical protein